MTHSQKNQLFIDSIQHWDDDGVEMFEDGYTISTDDHFNYLSTWFECWDNTKIYVNLNGSHCALCEVFQDDHDSCFLEYYDLIICCEAYHEFAYKPNLETCNAVIQYLWDRSQQVCHRDYHMKISWEDYKKWREDVLL